VGSGDAMPQRTIANALTQGGRCTCGHPHSMGVVMGGRDDGGNSVGVAAPVGAKEDLGEKASRGGSRPSTSAGW
jgi:hypothetical protein